MKRRGRLHRRCRQRTYVRYLLTGKFPFQAGGETASTASPQAGAFDDVDDVGRLFVEKQSASAKYPSRAMYSSIFSESMNPQLRKAMRSCFR